MATRVTRTEPVATDYERLRRTPKNVDIHVHPSDLGALFAKRPVILGEAESDYDDLLSKVTEAVQPTNVIEAMWVKDVVDLMWETQCFRRLRTSMLMNAGRQALIRILRTTKDLDTGKPMTPEVAELTAACYLIGDEENVQEVDELLKDYALDLDSIMAQALSDKLDDIERIDRMIAVADARRNKALAELESRRENLARRLRTATDQVIEAPSPNRSR